MAAWSSRRTRAWRGPYNQNVIKEAQRLLDQHPDTKLFVVGEYGRHFFKQHKIPVAKSFLYTAQNPTMDRAREICALLLDEYDRGELQEIFVVYTDMENSLTSQALSTRLLPFHRTYFAPPTKEKAVSDPFEFVPVGERGAGRHDAQLCGRVYLQRPDRQLLQRTKRPDDGHGRRQPERGEAAGRAVITV